jgi:hypothetical protein
MHGDGRSLHGASSCFAVIDAMQALMQKSTSSCPILIWNRSDMHMLAPCPVDRSAHCRAESHSVVARKSLSSMNQHQVI